MSEVRVLTVRQPWAWAIVHGGKDVENRVRNIAGDYRGPVAIHAGLSPNPGPWWAAIDPPFGSVSGDNFGAILGVVDLVGVHLAGKHYQNIGSGVTQIDLSVRACCPSWGDRDGYHLMLANPRSLSVPIPFKGALGLRRLPDDIAEQVWAGVTS